MFGSRKHAAPVQPLTKETANVNAATAAASAFKRRASDASLSSAAAAAALRARPTSPTIVADVQSKRLSRRSPSVSSATGRRREVTRTPSVGSMMERTFRSPSPGRSPASVPYDVPPIPSIPATDNYKPSSRPSSSSRKGGAGLQTQNFRTASEKMRDGQRGSWFAAASAHDLHTVRRTASELELGSARAPSEPRPGSVSPSINFSYPRARLRSPTGSLRSLQLDDQTLVYDPNSRRMVPRAQLEARSQAIYEEEDYQPIREKPQTKKAPRQPKEPKPPRISRAGSHLSRGTVARTRAPALETNEAEQPDPITEPEPEPEPEPSRAAELEAVAAPAKPRAKKKKKKQTGAPSTTTPDSATAEMSSSLVAPVKAPEMTATVSENSASTPPTAKKVAKSSEPNGATPSPNANSNVRAVASREPSESPARSARFAASTDQLLVRHEPPPRSLSPRKSALKHTSPTRAVSPSDDGSEVSGVPSSLTPNDDARKKSYRVSWDDRNTVVVSEPTAQHAAEQAASSSPQTKKLWHGIVGKGKKKEATVVETEETMSPRPALPSFGSVREKKPKEQEERPLVRPEHAIQTETPPAAITGLPVETNTGKLREPLPTVLPSVEKDEDVSSSEDGLMEDTSDDDSDSDAEAPHAAANGAATKRNATGNGVPEISVSHASPRQPQTDERGQIAPVRVGDDDASSGSEDLEEEDPHSHAAALPMDDIKEEEEEGDTYIDAYEEIDEPEGNGFQSLDAVLESPTSSPTTKAAKEKTVSEDEIPEATAAASNKSDPPDDWENAKAYWKSLSAAKRRQLEQEAMAEAGDEQQEKSKGSKIDTRKSSKAKAQNITPKKERSYQITPGTVQQAFESTPESTPTNSVLKANGNSMRKSMRDSPHNDAPNSEPKKLGGSLRKTLRPERPLSAGNDFLSQSFAEPSSPTSPSRMKRSLRHNSVDLSGAEVRPSLSGAGRPASYHAATNSPSSLRQTQSLRMNGSVSPVSATRGAVIKSSLRRRGSDSSESSFTRARASTSGVHEFRRSMRGSMREPPATSEGVKETNRFSLRPSSPPAMAIRRNSISSLPPAANFGAGRMRHSLRGVSADPPSRRRMPGFGKSAGKAKKGKGGSRFGDSSDEDEGPANFFRSRFADSSSEDDEPQTKPKGKGLPKSLRAKSNGRPYSSAVDLPSTQNGRESPSMFDNAILTQPKRTEAIGSPLGAPGSSLEIPAQIDDNDGPGRGSFRPQHTRRGSFISLLRRKKDLSSKITRDVSESAARQDTHLERSPQELEALRNTSMHKRGPSWPLPEPEEAGLGADHSPERPSTAGGAIVSTSFNKSKFARRRSASHGMVAADTADIDDDHLVTDTLPQKKKKFGALRKMFGLHD